MATSNNNLAMFFNLLLVFSFLLIFSMAESKILGIGFGNKLTPVCDKVYGAQSGDSCFTITQTFNLTAEFFSEINPNLVCTKIFVGQWLCIDGSAN